MRRFLILFISFLMCSLWAEATSIPFSPIARNFTESDYKAGIQNWSATQDSRGVMYFGNNEGLLEFDGGRWRLYKLPTGGIVRATYMAADGKIYVGSYEEFGYFERDNLNNLEYHSLKDKVEGFNFHNDEIWNIVAIKGTIVFQSFGSLFQYDGGVVTGYRTKFLPLNLLPVGDAIYSQLINEGLCVFNGKEFKEIISRSQLGNDDVVAGLSYKNGVLFLTRNSGGFIYSDNKLLPWHTECDSQLKHHSINRAVMTKDSCYIIGTLANGIYALDKEGRLLWRENSDNHLLNNTVLGLYCDLDNNVWVALDEGIAYIQNNSLVYYYEPLHRKVGMIYDVLVKENITYIASNQGLYGLKNGNLDLLPGLEEQAWVIKEWGNDILCGHNKGTFRISDMNSMLISNVRGAMCMKEMELEGQQILLQGTYTFLNVYKQNAPGYWQFSNSLRSFSHMVKNVEVDHRGNVWVEHMRKGLYKLKVAQDLQKVEQIESYMNLGDLRNGKYALFKIGGRVAFSNGEAFYTYEDMTDSIIPYKTMNEQLPELKNIHSVSHMRANLYWFVNDKMAYLVECGMNSFRIRNKIPFAIFGNITEERAKMVYDKRENSSYLCLNNAIARVAADSSRLFRSSVKPSLWISQFSVMKEVADDQRLLPIVAGNAIPSDFNNVTFSLAYPVYNNYSYKIRYKLEGLSGQWVNGSDVLRKEYTRLPFGSYIFKAEVYDDNGVISAVEMPFVIERPWYLSYWAIGGYVLSGLLLLLFLQYSVYIRVKRKKDRIIEQQRTLHQAEIEEQERKIIKLEKEQLEADLRFKSKELSGVVMTNIAHQEFLTYMKEEIQQQRLSGQYTRKNFDKLLMMINQNIVSDEENWNMFQANFDRIHENFFRNLKQQFPDLTAGDLRFCGLLRLNLPTKEIAKLMNISIRGVDAARYRLRKKLNLPQEDSLTDFMINFK